MHSNQWRNRRNQLNMSSIPAFGMQYNIASYSTESKSDLTKSFAEEMLIHNLHMIPNPLQKNLADTIPTAEPKTPPQVFQKPKIEAETVETETRSDNMLMGIGSFFSGVFSAISGGMFHRRRAPAPQYYDCCDRLPDWQPANRADLNKSTAEQSGAVDAMSADCRAAAAHCEDKLNRVRHLLTSKPVPTASKYKRRPRRAFVEPGSVEESFEDAFSPEDFVRLSNDDHIECFSPYNHHNEELIEANAPKVKTEMAPVKEVMDIVQTLPDVEIPESKPNTVETKTIDNHIETKNNEIKQDVPVLNTVEEPKDEKQEVIAACEDKVNKLKALLSRKPRTSRLDPKPETDSVTEPVPDKKEHPKCLRIETTTDKHFKNPNRDTGKRKKSQIMRNIQEDMCFPNTLEAEYVSSPENSPSLQPTQLGDLILPIVNELAPEPEPEYFDEVHGRFHSTSTTDSEDSFQIVFTDSPKASHSRVVSDCDSEDSFIVFEDSPDSCYTSHDVFGETESDSDSDVSDSGFGVSCKLSHSLTRTVGDLTDDSLFDETVRADSDEVDSATVCEDIPDFTEEVKDTGLLLNDAKKLLKRQQPPKKVSFSEKPPKVRVMRVWTYAARQARRGNWEQNAMDRDRFKRKIADVDMAVSWVLKPQHRSRVMFQRFMPWWNAQRRLEIAEKKRKMEEEKIKEEVRKKEELAREERIRAEGKDIEVSGVIDENGIMDGASLGTDVNEINSANGSKKLNKVKTVESDKEKVALNVKDDVNSVNRGVSGVKMLAKCDFYDKSGKLNSSNRNSIDVASTVAVDT